MHRLPVWNIRPAYKRALLIFFLVLIAGAGVVWYIFNEKFTDTHERDAAFTTEAMAFIRDYQKM